MRHQANAVCCQCGRLVTAFGASREEARERIYIDGQAYCQTHRDQKLRIEREVEHATTRIADSIERSARRRLEIIANRILARAEARKLFR